MNENNKILVFGSNGMLGDYFCDMAYAKGYQVLKNDRATGGVDITNEEQVRNIVYELNPKCVVNCAAYTNVEKAEEEKDIAFKVNADAPMYMAKVCKELQIPMIHISTDYVFGENKKEGYEENYKGFKPLNVYGESKLQGELNVLDQGTKSYIFRTSWLFGPHATNFIDKISQRARELPELKVVDDEIGCPTYVKDLSQAMFLAVEGKIEQGIYHVCSRDSLSRYEFAKEILKEQGIETPIVRCSLADFPRKAKVPYTSILINTKLKEARESREMINDYCKSLKNEYAHNN